MGAQIREETCSIVIIGQFSPVTLQPAWLARHGLIADDEATAAEVSVIHSKVAEFQAGDFHLQTLDGRMSISSSTTTSDDQIRDLCSGILQLLPETPVRALGINRNVHLTFDSEDVWNALGWKIAPKENWEPPMTRAGLRAVVIEDVRSDEYAGYIRVKTGPSDTYGARSIEIDINDHYEIAPKGQMTRGAEVLPVIEKEWHNSIGRAKVLIEHVETLAK